jgi:hypothetical protein
MTGATRQAVAAYVATHRGASHRAIARALGVSASSVDRACRAMRQATGAQCAHGHPVTHPADAPDARPDAVPGRHPGASSGAPVAPADDAPWRASVAPLHRREVAAGAPAADAVRQDRDAPAMTRPLCPCCGWHQMQPVPVGEVAHCEACGFAITAEGRPHD